MSTIIKKVELMPFRVPNYVIQRVPVGPRQEGFKESPKLHLSELDDETLDELCKKFREGVFEKARKPD